MFLRRLYRLDNPSVSLVVENVGKDVKYITWVLPKDPSACIRKMGFSKDLRLPMPAADSAGGLLIKVIFSQDGSISSKASRSHEDWVYYSRNKVGNKVRTLRMILSSLPGIRKVYYKNKKRTV